jgi:hypothetical protein
MYVAEAANARSAISKEKGSKDERFWEIAHHFYGCGSRRLRAK